MTYEYTELVQYSDDTYLIKKAMKRVYIKRRLLVKVLIDLNDIHSYLYSIIHRLKCRGHRYNVYIYEDRIREYENIIDGVRDMQKCVNNRRNKYRLAYRRLGIFKKIFS